MRICKPLAAGLVTVVGVCFAASGVSARAEPYEYDFCDTSVDPNDGTVYEVCASGSGVISNNDAASGNHQFFMNGWSTTTVTVNGVLVFDGTDRTQLQAHTGQDGGEQVFHEHVVYEAFNGGETCTGTINFTYANGELRHELIDKTCV